MGANDVSGVCKYEAKNTDMSPTLFKRTVKHSKIPNKIFAGCIAVL